MCEISETATLYHCCTLCSYRLCCCCGLTAVLGTIQHAMYMSCQNTPTPIPWASSSRAFPSQNATNFSHKNRTVDIGPRVMFVDAQASRELTHLIMVPCHGVTVTESLEGADSRDTDWFLLDYQKGKDVPRALVGHIQGGLNELDADKNSLLLFSGE